MEYRKDIQGLRALAVIFVLLFHINPMWVPGGFIGVDVFFVISGFLVSSIILKKLEAGTFSFADFYTGRLKRIAPAYYVLLLAVAVAGAFILMGRDIMTLKGLLRQAMYFNTNNAFAKLNSYFGMSLQQNPLLHTWTIAVEMKFYLILPLLLYFIKRKYLIYAISGLFVTLLLYGTYELELKHNMVTAYYSVLVRMPEFLMGVLLALMPKAQGKEKAKTIVGMAGLALITLCAFLFSYKTHFPGLMALVPCLGAAMLIWADKGPVFMLLSARPLEFTGMLSYSVYLWHWPIIAFLRYYNAGSRFTLAEAAFIIILTFACAWISYTFIENFFRKKKFPVLCYRMVPLGAVLVALYFFLPAINGRLMNIPQEYIGPSFGLKSHNTKYVEVLGDTTQKADILLMGNSHALCMKAYMDYLGKANGFSFRTISCDSYPPIEGITEEDGHKMGVYADYVESRSLIPLVRKEVEQAHVIVMVLSSWSMVPSLIPAIDKMASGLKKGQQLVLITPFPILDKNPVLVNRDFIKNKGKEQNYRIIYRKELPQLAELALKNPSVHLLNLQESTAFKTAPYYNDTLMYYDQKHLNPFGARVLAKHTEKQFMEFLDALPK